VRASEWLTIAYFAYLGVLALMRPTMAGRRRALILIAGIIAALLLSVALPPGPMRERARD